MFLQIYKLYKSPGLLGKIKSAPSTNSLELADVPLTVHVQVVGSTAVESDCSFASDCVTETNEINSVVGIQNMREYNKEYEG